MSADICGFCQSTYCVCGQRRPIAERVRSLSEDMVVLDVWGGYYNQDHVARFILNMNDALIRARRELIAGFPINLRVDVAWGEVGNFDTRSIS